MKTNELKKGTPIKLANGWQGVLADNKRGNIRLAEVYGHYTEIGSVYAHDIVGYSLDGEWYDDIELTANQKKLKDNLNAMGW